MQEGQDRIYYLLAENYATAIASPHLEQLRRKNIEVLLLTDRIDPWLVDALREYDGKQLCDIAREGLSLPDDDGAISQEVANEQHKPLLKKIKRVLKDRVEAVNISRRLVDSPACVVAGEGDLNPTLKRMLEASGQSLPETKPILEVNIGHPLLERLSGEADDARFNALSNVLLDHALLAEGRQIENPAEYVARMNRLLLELDSAPGGK
jgi:molecular chaperone HtpG